MKGKIHSFQSLGTVDGPGVRAVVFMQGCPLRCVCCHNPDTWDMQGGTLVDTEELFGKINRLRAYFGQDGGLTVSGGEPLMQSEFVLELFERCKSAGINCALDTSGCVYNEKVDRLLDACDLVLLDYKYVSDKEYRDNCGCSKASVDEFLEKLSQKRKRVWIRHVVIPELNDRVDSLRSILELEEKYSCIEKIEFLPFRKLCSEKYKKLGIEFPLENTPEGDREKIDKLLEMARLK